MKIRATGRRLGTNVARVETKKAASSTASPAQKARTDRLELSKSAINFLAEQTRQLTESIGQMGQDREKESSGQSSMLDSTTKKLDIMDKCTRISGSISAGDRVPPEDLRYLKEHDMTAYLLALVTRKPKEDPEDKDSVLSEEDIEELEGRTQEGSQAAPAPTVSTDE